MTSERGRKDFEDFRDGKNAPQISTMTGDVGQDIAHRIGQTN